MNRPKVHTPSERRRQRRFAAVVLVIVAAGIYAVGGLAEAAGTFAIIFVVWALLEWSSRFGRG